MDPVSVFTSVAVILAFTRDVATLVKRIRDPLHTREISVSASLTAEQLRLATWTENMNVRNWQDLENILREEDKQAIRPLWDNVFKLVNKAQTHVGQLNDSTNKFYVRMRWATGEYEELVEVVQAIHNINEALYAVSTPPPRYNPRIEPPPPIDPPLEMHNPSTSHESQTHQDQENTDSETQPRSTSTIYKLFQQTVNGLLKICSTPLASEELSGQLAALKRWPGTFLEGDLALDDLLGKKVKNKLVYENLRTTLMTTLIDILLLEESLLTYLVTHTSRQDVYSMLLSIVSTFTIDEVHEIESKRTSDLQGFEERELFEKGSESLSLAIEDLYDLLPAIRLLRRGELLDREQKSSALTPIPVLAENTLQRLIENTDIFIKAAESEASTSSLGRAKLRIIQKEKARLAEFAAQIPADQLERNKQERIQKVLLILEKSLPHSGSDKKLDLSQNSKKGSQDSKKGSYGSNADRMNVWSERLQDVNEILATGVDEDLE